MQLLLDPDLAHVGQLRKLYRTALRDATQLYIASAYLTAWDEGHFPSTGCKEIVFIVGTDFGLSRKAAIRSALAWMPKRGSCRLLAAPRMASGGFHPKLVAWRTKTGRHYVLLGSSNLSDAAFEKNYEANGFGSISASQFKAITTWLEPLIAESEPVTEDWIEHDYREARLKGGTGTGAGKTARGKTTLPTGASYAEAVRERRKHQESFKQLGKVIKTEARLCAAGKTSNLAFWKRFWKLWSTHASRFQGNGIQLSGRSANWRQACQSLNEILEAAAAGSSQSALDAIVIAEIDRLRKLRNPARGAWLSEMLCHFFPDAYPVRNAPVLKWLRAKRWRARRGASEGQRYLDLASKLRHVVASRPNGARNLAELDIVIWLSATNRGL